MVGELLKPPCSLYCIALHDDLHALCMMMGMMVTRHRQMKVGVKTL